MAGNIYSQIPNSGFEDWDDPFNPTVPLEWTTNATANLERVVRTDDRTEGEFALKLIPSSLSAWQGCGSVVYVDVPLPNPLDPMQSLYFNTKLLPLDTVSNEGILNVQMEYFLQDSMIYSLGWQTREPILDYKTIEIPLPNLPADAFRLTFAGAAVNAPDDGCLLKSEIWIDEVEISKRGLTATSELDRDQTAIYPNPSSGHFHIVQADAAYDRVDIYDFSGKLIRSQGMSSSGLIIDAKGTFLIRLWESASGAGVTHKVVVE